MNGFLENIKRAFKWHWNLLYLGAGIAFALLSGQPAFLLPLLAAGELAYLAFLGTSQRFQKILIGKELLEKTEKSEKLALSMEQLRQFNEYLDFLGPEDRERFGSIQRRARALLELQKSLRGTSPGVEDPTFKTQSLDKMVWLFLKLLHHREGLRKFLVQTDEGALNSQLREARSQLEKARSSGGSPKLVDSLEEKQRTIESRLTNYKEVKENREILEAEIDKTEQKINHICEAGMTSSDPSALSSQIDGVADSVRLSQESLRGLDISGIFEDSTAPPLVSQVELESE